MPFYNYGVKKSGDLRKNYLIDNDELLSLIKDGSKDLKIVNCTWYMPHLPNDPWKEHLDKRITADTVYFNHDVIQDPKSDLPHTLPDKDFFIHHMRRLGIRRDMNIVVYDA